MVLLVNQTAQASCNPKIDIRTVGADSYLYQEKCHIDYGRLRKTEPLYKEQTKELRKSIEMKDLALKYSNERTETWQKTTYKLEDKLLKLESNYDKMKWVYFGLGILVTGTAVWAAGQLK